MLAVSSLATYGILLAGSPSKAHNHHFHNKCSCKYRTNAIINITQKRFIHRFNLNFKLSTRLVRKRLILVKPKKFSGTWGVKCNILHHRDDVKGY